MTDIDLHDIRSSLKLITDTGGHAVYANKSDVACPVCGDPFDEVLELTDQTHSVDPDRPISFCIVNEPESVFIFTHV